MSSLADLNHEFELLPVLVQKLVVLQITYIQSDFNRLILIIILDDIAQYNLQSI